MKVCLGMVGWKRYFSIIRRNWRKQIFCVFRDFLSGVCLGIGQIGVFREV